MLVGEVESPQNHVEYRQTGATEQHKASSAQTFYGRDSDKRKDAHHNTGNDDVKEDTRERVAGGREDLFGVVEDNIDTAPLLQHREGDADPQHRQQARIPQSS